MNQDSVIEIIVDDDDTSTVTVVINNEKYIISKEKVQEVIAEMQSFIEEDNRISF